MAPGDIYWKNSQGSSVLLRRRGDWLDYPYLQKFEKKNIQLFVSNNIDVKWVSEFYQITTDYMFAKNLQEKEELWKNWLIAVKERYWDNTHRDLAFELKLIMENIFYDFSDEETEKNINIDIDLYDRYLMIATDTVFLLLLLGINDKAYLSKMYKLMLSGFNLIKNEMITASLKQELENFFSGKISTLEKVSIENFLNQFQDEESKFLMSMSFEGINGEGSLYQVYDNEISDIERIVIFSNRTRAVVGDNRNMFVFELIKNKMFHYMSPILLKKIEMFMKEPVLVVA